ncbi:MAG: hypothetical protein HC866_01415 [Leptolyngbyaceae cyanobacterium RU_5_1]|nr:hypothetical protein [Leptolyngbyaceae cyanobacterium RU_5_1]
MMNRVVQWLRRNPLTAVFAIVLTSTGVAASAISLRPPTADAELTQPAVAPLSVGDRVADNAADSRAVLSLARHLKKVGAKMYGAYWCPHCKHQQEMFGEAFKHINYIECDPKGANAKPALCKAAKVTGYPTWEIKGKFYVGTQSLDELATSSNYKGSRSF